MYSKAELIGRSGHIKELYEFIKKAAKSSANVLLLGETGVGKKIAAEMIHSFGDRKEFPFIKINCANLSESLLESELFGHKRGSYTGAVFDKQGLIETANRGTFFFDEIADISPSLQAKFLSVIEEKNIRRIGENMSRDIDVRFILATNKDVLSMVRKSRFRSDLFFRISILTFRIAPLRDRKEDIPALAKSYLKRFGIDKSANYQLTKTALEKLMNYSYPGNIRELENILERATVISDNRIIKERYITFLDYGANDSRPRKNKCSHEIILKTVEKYHGNKTKAAKELGLSRQWVHKVLKDFISNI